MRQPLPFDRARRLGRRQDQLQQSADRLTIPAAGRSTGAPIAVLAAIFAVAVVPLLTTPVLPFVDLYNHLARYFVLAHLGANPTLQQFYAANWSLLPNIGLDVVGTALLPLVPAAWAAHAVVIVILATEFAGILAFNRALTGRTSPVVAVLVVPLLYSYILDWGFANFLLGLGLVFAAAAWWLRRRDRLAVGLPVACVAAVVVFLTHGLAFALYGILVVALEVGLWLRQPAHRLAGLVRALVPVAVQAVIPVLLFLAAPTSHGAAGISNADTSVARLASAGALGGRLWTLLCYRLTTIVRVEEGPALWFDVACLALQIAVVGILVARGRARIGRAAWPAIAVGVVLVVVIPPALFGVGYVADRMPLFLAAIVVGSLDVAPLRDRAGRVALAVLAGIAIVRLVAIGAGWQAYRGIAAEFDRVAQLVPPGALVADAYAGGSHHDDRLRFQMFRPLLISRHGAIGPLFANETQQPLLLVGPLRRALDALGRARGPVASTADDYANVAAAAGQAGFDYLLLCHDAPIAPVPGRVVAATAHFTLLGYDRTAASGAPIVSRTM